MKRSLTEALAIDFIGLILFSGVLTMITNPPLSLSSRQLMGIGLIFPLIAYTITYKRTPEEFWKAFFGSVGIGLVLFMGLISVLLIGV